MDIPHSPPCLRCGAPSREWRVPADRHGGEAREVRACTSAVCGIAFTWPQFSGMTEAAPAAGELSVVGGAVAARMAAASVARLGAVMPRGSLVVDVGAGTGLRAKALAKMGFAVVAIEPDAVEEERAHVELAGTGVEVHRAGVDDLADVLDGRVADAVVMWHVLEHLPTPDAALAQIGQCLRGGGVLNIAVPNRSSLEASVFGNRWHAWEPSRHRWHYDEHALRLVLGEAGFSVNEISPRGGWGYPSSLAFSLAPRLDPQVHPRRGVPGRLLAAAMIPVALGARAVGRGGQLVTLARRI